MRLVSLLALIVPCVSFLGNLPLRPSTLLLASPAAACEEKIRAAISVTELEVLSSEEDPNGSHIMVTAVSAAFEGLSSMKRQQLVYKAIWEEVQSGAVHAVDQMVLKTPDEAGS